MTTLKKQAIVQSLDSMSAAETELLLSYIRGLLYNPDNDLQILRKKARGMREIKQALMEELPF